MQADLRHVIGKEYKDLPHWACVALAARSAMRVQPLYEACWSTAPKLYIDSLPKAIDLAWEAAANASIHGVNVDPFAYDAYSAAQAARSAAGTEISPRGAAAAYAAAMTASWAAKSADIQNGPAASDAADATMAASGAWEAATGHRTVDNPNPILIESREDYELLSYLAEKRHWTDDTPIPQGTFKLLWTQGLPYGWPTSVYDVTELPSDRPLVTRILVEHFMTVGVVGRKIDSDAKTALLVIGVDDEMLSTLNAAAPWLLAHFYALIRHQSRPSDVVPEPYDKEVDKAWKDVS